MIGYWVGSDTGIGTGSEGFGSDIGTSTGTRTMEAERDAEMGSLSDQITKKLLLFNAGGVQMRGPLLSKVYKWLIQVTSVERNFSQVEPICNKLRTRLSDRSICDLSMFKTYFKNE